MDRDNRDLSTTKVGNGVLLTTRQDGIATCISSTATLPFKPEHDRDAFVRGIGKTLAPSPGETLQISRMYSQGVRSVWLIIRLLRTDWLLYFQTIPGQYREKIDFNVS